MPPVCAAQLVVRSAQTHTHTRTHTLGIQFHCIPRLFVILVGVATAWSVSRSGSGQKFGRNLTQRNGLATRLGPDSGRAHPPRLALRAGQCVPAAVLFVRAAAARAHGCRRRPGQNRPERVVRGSYSARKHRKSRAWPYATPTHNTKGRRARCAGPLLHSCADSRPRPPGCTHTRTHALHQLATNAREGPNKETQSDPDATLNYFKFTNCFI